MFANYTFLLILFQYFLLTIDIICNIFDDYLGYKLTLRLTVFIVQDFAQLLSLIILCLLLFQTTILQSGHFDRIFKQQSYAVIVAIIYFLMTFTLQTLIVKHFWPQASINDNNIDSKKWIKNRFTLTLFICQRIFSAFHYYCNRKASSFLHSKSWCK